MDELKRFVERALEAGQGKEAAGFALQQAGWQEDEVRDALAHYADVAFPVAVPVPRRQGTAREAFLYLVTFFALYTWAIALGNLLFGVIEHYLPDRVIDNYDYYYDGADSGLRWAIAAIAVAFPIYFLLTRAHLKAYREEPERRRSSARRWLTYLTLFVAACVIIGYLIYFIGNVLDGEIAMRFILKCAVVMLLAGGTFGYYFHEMRLADGQERKR